MCSCGTYQTNVANAVWPHERFLLVPGRPQPSSADLGERTARPISNLTQTTVGSEADGHRPVNAARSMETETLLQWCLDADGQRTPNAACTCKTKRICECESLAILVLACPGPFWLHAIEAP